MAAWLVAGRVRLRCRFINLVFHLSACAVAEALQRQHATFPVPGVPTPSVRTPPETLQRLSRTFKVSSPPRLPPAPGHCCPPMAAAARAAAARAAAARAVADAGAQAHCVRMASAYSAHLQETVHAQEMWKVGAAAAAAAATCLPARVRAFVRACVGA